MKDSIKSKLSDLKNRSLVDLVFFGSGAAVCSTAFFSSIFMLIF